MNINSSSATMNSPQIINYPRPLIDRKPDDEQTSHNVTRYVINSNQSVMTSSTSATVPQTVSIPLLSISGAGVSSANGVIAAKKCAFHRQCLHIHQSSSQPQPQQQAGHHQQNMIHHHLHPHQIQLPLQTASTTTAPPPQQSHPQHHQQLQQIHQIQHQQIRINNYNNNSPTSGNNISIASAAITNANVGNVSMVASTAGGATAVAASATAAITFVNRSGGSQPKRDAISTNIAPQLNAALLQDRYLLLDMVDGSSFYKCIDIQTQKMLVCKIVNNPCANLLTAHFRLDGHPNVNYLEKVIQNTSQTYLFFEPSQGDLHSHVRVRKRLRENEARRLFRQMCEVVKTCHEQGIVLRDLKLRKFVFADSERTQIKLESLEDAVVLDNPAEDSLQDKRGCPAYVSPEILRANTTYSGKAADMWSLGVILYTMLVGRYPFNDSEHASLFAKISRGIYVVPDCLSSKARCIIRALLRRDPEERITSEDVLFHPWLRHDDEHREIINSKSNISSADDQCVPEWYANQEDDCEVPSI